MDDKQKLHNSLDYIHNNPVEAGIVEKAEDYLYSSARDYYGRHKYTTAPGRGCILAPNGRPSTRLAVSC